MVTGLTREASRSNEALLKCFQQMYGEDRVVTAVVVKKVQSLRELKKKRGNIFFILSIEQMNCMKIIFSSEHILRRTVPIPIL